VFEPYDEDFQANFLLRSPVELRSMSQSPNPDLPTSFWFVLRALFGVNARSDLMLYLLTHGEAHPGAMARRLDYTPRALQETLNEMAGSGHVVAWRFSREKRFSITREEWRFLWELDGSHRPCPRWLDWPAVFTALDRVHNALMNPQLEDGSEFLRGVEIRSLLDQDDAGKALVETGVLSKGRGYDRLTGDDLVEVVLEDLREFLG